LKISTPRIATLYRAQNKQQQQQQQQQQISYLELNNFYIITL
jgi:hypothetical protein